MARKRSKESDTDRFKTLPLFASCTKKELGAIAGAAKEVDFQPGHVICREGETGIGLHVIVEGQTKVLIGGRTRRRLGPGSFFGEVALLDGGPRTATVIAETPVKSLVIAVWNFRSLLKENPSLALKMLEEVCRRLRGSSSSLND